MKAKSTTSDSYMRHKRLRFGTPNNAAERAACRWLLEHSGDEGEGVMRSLADAMRRYAEERFRPLAGGGISEPHPGNEDGTMQPGSCAHCGQFHSTAACPPKNVEHGQFGVGA